MASITIECDGRAEARGTTLPIFLKFHDPQELKALMQVLANLYVQMIDREDLATPPGPGADAAYARAQARKETT